MESLLSTWMPFAFSRTFWMRFTVHQNEVLLFVAIFLSVAA